MIKRYKRFFILAGIFIGSSALIYFIHYRIFHDPHHIFIFMLSHLAFLPIHVFLVVIVIENLLARREKQARLNKLNMVVGTFFSEVGNHLLSSLLNLCENRDEIFNSLSITQNWTKSDFKKARAYAGSVTTRIDYRSMDLQVLRTFLIQKRAFLVRLLDNPNILEHERFTPLLWSVSHLDEELEARPSLKTLPDSDLEHIASDIQRVYGQLTVEWLYYVEHLKAEYPFLFSLVLRTHPFQAHPSPVVT